MKAKVVSNSCIRGVYYKLTLKLPYSIGALPGQFFMIRPGILLSSSDPLLPRPFSIHRLTPDGHLDILYQVIGKGTTLLAHTVEGEELEILGPLGNGFDIGSGESAGEILIVAGGMGVAPMLGLTEVLRASYPEKTITVFLGGKSAGDLLCVDELKKAATEVTLATQDGSVGVKGYVTVALEEYLSRGRGLWKGIMIYACGPSPMLQRILDLTSPLKNVGTYFSLEANMACGIGICMGCAIKKRDAGYYLVCKDGPVFKGETLDLNYEA